MNPQRQKVPESFAFQYSITMRVPDPIRTLSVVKLEGGNAWRVAAVLLPVLMAGLAACTATKSGTTISAPRTVEASKAMIVPAPGGPTVISVIEQRFSDAVEQKVILGTDAANEGQNYLSIRLYGPMERETRGAKSLGYKSFTAVGLNNEASRAVPGVAMTASTLFLRNNYGPFGYAFGQSSGGDSCIFGWQQLRSREAERESFRNAGAIQIRLRLCENGASEKDLLGVMYGYTVTGSFTSDQWNPFGAPKDVSDKLTNGDPVYPEDSDLQAPAKVVAAEPVRRKPVLAKRQTGEDVSEDSVEDETAAKRIVDVPAPAADDDSNAAVIDNVTTSDTSSESRVLVPGPACPDGDSSCN